jgi:hypothetical protein
MGEIELRNDPILEILICEVVLGNFIGYTQFVSLGIDHTLLKIHKLQSD